MNNTNIKKQQQLGLPFGTASARLKLTILFNLVQKTNQDICFKCDKKIETPDELSIEHKKVWLDVSPDLFWALDNIAFSHRKCNKAERKPRKTKSITHGLSSSYHRRKCRCEICVKAHKQRCLKWKIRTNYREKYGQLAKC